MCRVLNSEEADSKGTLGIRRSLNRPTRSIVCSILTSLKRNSSYLIILYQLLAEAYLDIKISRTAYWIGMGWDEILHAQ